MDTAKSVDCVPSLLSDMKHTLLFSEVLRFTMRSIPSRPERHTSFEKPFCPWPNSDKKLIQTYYCQPTILVCKDHKR